MARTRGFTEESVLRSAAEAFTEGGYEGTSVDDLVKALNLHRGSLYKAFGSKRGVFLAGLRYYVETHLPSVIRGDSDEGHPADMAALTRGRDLDLLLVAALERGHRDPAVAALVRQGLVLVQHACEAAHPLPATDDAARPTRAIQLLGIRLYERLHDDTGDAGSSLRPPQHATKET